MLKEIAEGVYVENGFEGGNVGLIVTPRGAVLVDVPMLPSDARQWQLALMQLGISETYAVVNTDYHIEHVLGNAFFAPARIIGHESSLKPMAKYEPATLEQLAAPYRDSNPALADEIAAIQIAPPELTVGRRLVLHLGRQVEVWHLEGHTSASLGVYLPEERVLFAGEAVVNNEHPIMVNANSRAWLRTLEQIREMGVEVIVPGNGEPVGATAIEPLYRYIREMRERTGELFQRGASRRETVDKVGMLDFFPVPDEQAARIKRRRRENVERIYTEVRLASRKREG